MGSGVAPGYGNMNPGTMAADEAQILFKKDYRASSMQKSSDHIQSTYCNPNKGGNENKIRQVYEKKPRPTTGVHQPAKNNDLFVNKPQILAGATASNQQYQTFYQQKEKRM